MPTFIALLRGVNVGKGQRVPMATLRELLAGLGHTEVKTLLNSGNAAFRAASRSEPAHARRIAAALHASLGVDVPVIVKSAPQLAAVVAENPFADAATDPSRLLLAFTQADEDLAPLGALQPLLRPGEGLAIGRHAVYLHCPCGILDSKAGAALLGPLGRAATTRNWSTTLKLHALAAGRQQGQEAP
jgi:uncharacterized protein (DUF1697 family)